MNKIKFKDGTEIEIESGSSWSDVIVPVEGYAEIENVVSALTEENLSDITFYEDDIERTHFANMVLRDLQLRIILDGEKIKVGFGLRELTEEEKKEGAINTALSFLNDEQALAVKDLCRTWDSLIGQTVDPGTRFTYKNVLYKTIGSEPLKIEAQWIPGEGTESLYVCIDETHAGTQEDPIPWVSNMQPENGKYYVEGDLVAKCIEDPGQPLYHKLSELCPGRYFEKA